MIDIHNHLMFNVDDGSKDQIMSEKLLLEYQKQGIKTIFLTPHVNSSVTKASREEQKRIFIKMKEMAKKFNLKLYLGAEIYISFRIPEINFKDHVMGKSNYLLLEFSTYHKTLINDHVYNLMQRGFKVILAHVERYDYLSEDDLNELKRSGALFQVNCSSILKIGNKSYSKKAWRLLKRDLIDFVATDTHNITSRPPRLKEAFDLLAKKIGINKATDLVMNNQNKYLINL